jgi:hypothetical protein
MVFRQLTIDANDPAVLARFWAQALGYQPAPPAEPQTTWHAHYRARLGEDAAFGDRLFDPAGLRPPIWFRQVPVAKAGKNRLRPTRTPAANGSAASLTGQTSVRGGVSSSGE